MFILHIIFAFQSRFRSMLRLISRLGIQNINQVLVNMIFLLKNLQQNIRRVGDYWTDHQGYKELDKNVAALRLQRFFKTNNARREQIRRVQELFQFKR